MYKKIISIIMFTFILLYNNLIFADDSVVRVDSINFDMIESVKVDNSNEFFRLDTYIDGYGNTFCNNLLYSADNRTWDVVFGDENNLSDELEYFLTECIRSSGYMQIIKCSTGYIFRARTYDDEYVYRETDINDAYDKILFVLDDFSYYSFIKIDVLGILDMSYYGDECYLEVATNWIGTRSYGYASDIKILKSQDLVSWNETDKMPLINGSEIIWVSPGKHTMNYTNNKIYIYNKGNTYFNDCGVKYEDFTINNIKVVGDYYIGTMSSVDSSNISYIAISKDGVYFSLIEIPNEDISFHCGITANNGIYLRYYYNDIIMRLNSGGLVYYLDNETLKDIVKNSDIYVRLNDTILGFAQPPVMEDDRTLVPMRFLFEQMGAEVEWDDSTQTATATVPVSTEQQIATFSLETENSVTFSIDNLNATVNGELETMDVPARLINDQTFVPLRFLSENLGYNVEWDEETNTAIITTE